VARLTLSTVAALSAVVPRVAAQGRVDAWAPQTVPLVGASYSPDVGLLLGAGIVHTRYGFRALPPSTRLIAQGAYATSARTVRVDVAGEFRRPLAPSTLKIELRVSGLELIRFYGAGNTTAASQPDSVYRARQRLVRLAPSITVPLAPRVRLTAGPLLQHSHLPSDPGTLLSTTGPYYGAGDFGQVGARAVLEIEERDIPAAPAAGAHVSIGTTWYPAVWNAVRPFGTVWGEASTYVSAGYPPTATLALRVGGATVSGTVPLQELVYVGGATTLRGYDEQRFAGRRGAFGNVELRLSVGWLPFGDLGILGLADAGRVWVPGESSDRWHAAAGGGVWLAWQHRRTNIISITAARSPERTAIYVRAGFLF
jgi:Omp85 superfamily domain